MNNKDKYGEVFTPESVVNTMIEDSKKIMGSHFFKKRQYIFETGAGKGIFYNTLKKTNDLSVYHSYFMNEINPSYESILSDSISKERKSKDKVKIGDLFSLNHLSLSFDFIWGNLPFQSGGKGFVPSLAKKNTHNPDIKHSKANITIWPKMIHYLFTNVLKEGGYFFCIIPCIWLKPDRALIYNLFVKKYTICFLRIFNCYDAHKLFGYNCQTPICYVMVKKLESVNHEQVFKLYDNDIEDYIDFTLLNDYCIPTAHASLFQKQVLYIKKCDSYISCYDRIKKISTLKNDIIDCADLFFNQKTLNETGELEGVSLKESGLKSYKVITGSSIDKKKDKLILHGFTSIIPGLYYGIPKLILPHKRLFRIFKDINGSYSCYGRDIYVFLCPNGVDEINELEEYLSNENIVKMIEHGFNIRMNFIEKYVFQYIEYLKKNE